MNLLAYSTGGIMIVFFTKYCESYIRERAEADRRIFALPIVLAVAFMLIAAYYFIAGKLVVYENGIEAQVYDYPLPVRLIQIAAMLPVPAAALAGRKSLGGKAVLLLCFSNISPFFGWLIGQASGFDLSAVFAAGSFTLIASLLQRDSFSAQAEKTGQLQRLANQYANRYEAVMLADLDTGRFKTLSAKEGVMTEAGPIPFSEAVLKNVMKYVNEADRQTLADAVGDFGRIKREYAVGESRDVEYRSCGSGRYIWYSITLNRVSEDELLIALRNCDDEVNERNARLMEAEEAQKLIESVAASYDVAYAVNMRDDTYRLLKNDSALLSDGSRFRNYSESKEAFFRFVHGSDRERMRRELDFGNIRSRLKSVKSYNVEFRTLIGGATYWHEMNVTLIDGDNVALGFADRDVELTKLHLEEKRYEEYFALFVVDLDTSMLKIIKNEEHYKVVPEGKAVPYTSYIRDLAKELEGEPGEFYMKISDLEYVKRDLAKEDKRSYSYKSTHIEGNKWVDVTAFVILRHEDGSPAMFTLGFSVEDALSAGRQELQSRLRENMQMIGGLASRYDALYYINIDEEILHVYTLDEEKYPDSGRLFDDNRNIFEIVKGYGQSEHIHPDDRHLFNDFGAETIREKLSGSKKYSMRFRVLTDGGYRWDEMDVVKYEDIDERPNAVAIGFADRDSEIRAEQAVNSTFEILGMELPVDEAVNRILAIVGDFYGAERSYVFEYSRNVGLTDNTYEWCAAGTEPMIDRLQRLPMDGVEGWNREFRRQGAFLMDTLDSEQNTEETVAILEMQGIDSLVAAPLMNGEEIAGFIGVDNPKKAKTDIGILKKAAAVIYSEILKRRENDEEHVTLGRLTGAFLSVYYTDLSTDYMRTWKMAEEYADTYGSVRNYSVAMGGYVRSGVPERDRERCIRETSPEYILEQFRTKDRFSVDMTDILLGYERSVVFDFIKVSDDGSRLVICSRDVTDSIAKEREQQRILEDALRAADAANKAKTDFLFSMSHDIRTPMNAITGFTNMAVKHIDDRVRVLDCLDKTQKAGMMLLSLINSILEVSRIEAGHAVLEEQPGDVYYSFANIESTMLEMAGTKDIDLSFEFGGITDRYVYADFSRCMRVFVNVISNAVKYTPEGGRVRVRCEQLGKARDGRGIYRYTVADNGIGMSEEFQKHVFEQFSREKTATVSGIQGTGLGMAVVKSFVELLGGTVSVKSRQGEGSVFTIDLPFRLQEGEAYTDPDSGEVVTTGFIERAEQKTDIAGRNVLLVEDNELNREIAMSILEDEGLLVEDADDGTTALRIMREKGPDYFDFILMDIQMPVMGGYEATKAIREMYPDRHIPIIALSANAFAEDKAKSREAGMDDHVAKPINVTELFNALEKFL